MSPLTPSLQLLPRELCEACILYMQVCCCLHFSKKAQDRAGGDAQYCYQARPSPGWM